MDQTDLQRFLAFLHGARMTCTMLLPRQLCARTYAHEIVGGSGDHVVHVASDDPTNRRRRAVSTWIFDRDGVLVARKVDVLE